MPEQSHAFQRVLARVLPVVALLISAGAWAEAPRIFAITGARIVTAPGTVIEHGTIVLRDGLIESVGANVSAPADAEVIKAEPGWSVYPAFIDAASSVGLDTEAAPAGRKRGGPPPKKLGARHELKSVHPEDRVVDRLDLGSNTVANYREMGFAMAHVVPDKGVFRGESALVSLRKAPTPDLIVQARTTEVIALEAASFMAGQYPSSTFGAVATVRQVLLDAQRQAVWRTRYAADPAGMAAPPYHSSDAPLLDVLQGNRPVLFVTINGLDPGRFRNLAAEFSLAHTAVVARNLGDRVDDLGAADMPVLLPLELPEKPDLGTDDDLVETSMQQMQRWLMASRLPGALDAVGVKVAFVTLGMKSPRNFQENLAAIVKAGYSTGKALAALTTTPAELLGVSRRTGTLEPGKQANLLVVDGDLFVDKPKLRHVFVDGYHEAVEPGKVVGDPNAAATIDARTPVHADMTLDAALATTPYPVPPETPAEVLIRNGRVWTMSADGILEGTDVLLKDGRIAAIGKDLRASANALVIDATGRDVTPGIIDAHSHSATEQLDLNEGVNSISSEVRIRDVLDPRAEQIYQQLAGGVTVAHVLHGSGNPIGGQSAIVKYRWGVQKPDDLVFEGAPPTIKFALGENPTHAAFRGGMPGGDTRYPASRMGVSAFMRANFELARQYEQDWKRYNALSKREQARTPPPRRDLRLEPLVEILNGERTVHSHSYRADEILMLMRLGDELGFRIGAFHHALEGYRVADEMAAHGAGASTFSDWWSFKMEAYDAIPWNAAIMEQRGVLVSLNSDSANLARRLNLEAAKMLHYGGLAPEPAFAMVTINPARQLGIDGRVGSLAVGKDADVVVWSGDPLSVYTRADLTLVDGKVRFDRQRDETHRAEVAAARAELASEIRGGKAVAPLPGVAGSNPPPPKVDYQWARGIPAGPVAIIGATVHTLEGPAIGNGVVVFAGGRITAVGGSDTAIPAGAERIDASGKHLWPSLIHLNTVLGLHEIDSVAGSVDDAETGDINADADTAVAVNAASTHFPVARSGGISHALVVPGGGLVSGSTTFLRTDGWTWEEMTALRKNALAVRWPQPPPPQYQIFLGPPKSPAERREQTDDLVQQLDQLLDDAEAYDRARSATKTGHPVRFDPQLDALLPVVRGERPLWATAREKYSIEAVVNWAARRGIRVVIADGRDAWQVADLLAQHHVPVVLTDISKEPARIDAPYDVQYAMPARLEKAGVLFAIASPSRTGGSANARHMRGFAGIAAAYGLDREAAYRSITLNPARILGLDAILGSIKPGKSASLVLTNGDLLEPSTTVEQVWIDGTRPSMDDVQKAAWRKWSNRPKYSAEE